MFERFRCGLERHILQEEDVLFPAFERLTGMATGPTVVMRSEHLELRQLMSSIELALTGNEGETARRVMHEVGQLLTTHNEKEERILYPATDRVATPDARHEIVLRMDELEE